MHPIHQLSPLLLACSCSASMAAGAPLQDCSQLPTGWAQSKTLARGASIQAGRAADEHLLLGTDYAAIAGPSGLEFVPLLGRRVERSQVLQLSV
jgi:hypothetical protein